MTALDSIGWKFTFVTLVTTSVTSSLHKLNIFIFSASYREVAANVDKKVYFVKNG